MSTNSTADPISVIDLCIASVHNRLYSTETSVFPFIVRSNFCNIVSERKPEWHRITHTIWYITFYDISGRYYEKYKMAIWDLCDLVT